MALIKAKAKQCNPQGKILDNTPFTDLHLNDSLIRSIVGNTITLIDNSMVLAIDGNYYTDFRLADNEKLPNNNQNYY